MLEALVVFLGIGAILSSRHCLGFANPFQIYFFIWFLVYLVYFIYRDSFFDLSVLFLLCILSSTLLSFVALSAASLRAGYCPQPVPTLATLRVRTKLLYTGQWLVTLALVPTFIKAQNLSGENVFSIVGYVRLRASITHDGLGYGLLVYCFSLSFVLTSIAAVLQRQRRIGPLWLLVSLFTSLLYAYLSTARTSVLLLFCLLTVPFFITRSVSLVGKAFWAVALFGAFSFVATMTKKGVSLDASAMESLIMLADVLRAYTISPIVAISQQFDAGLVPEYGVNSLRFFVTFANAIGLSSVAPVELIKEFVYVPDRTNVFTVYQPYVRDFTFLGFFVPPVFLMAHQWLYRKAGRIGGRWVFYYSASVYPLVMQFFHDQYATLLSQWIQIGFWYAIFIRNSCSACQRE